MTEEIRKIDFVNDKALGEVRLWVDDFVIRFGGTVADWMKEYTHGSEQYPDIQYEGQEADFEVILQAAKVLQALKDTSEQIETLWGMIDG